MAKNNKPSLKRNIDYDKKNTSFNIPQFDLKTLSPIPRKNTFVIIVIIILLLIMILTVNTSEEKVNKTTNNTSEAEKIVSTNSQIGNSTLGYVYKEGPYGNTSSDVKIAYILGVHPREKGAHQLMEQAFKEKENNLQYCYYIYRVNVTENPTDFSASRYNGQLLAKQFIVPDAINNNFTFAIDSHYSNGAWGVARFVFTPNENNTLSSQIGHALSDNFDWMTYYTPTNPSSPEYVTGPLNDGGVAAIIYEAYTEDNKNVTLEHDRQLVDFIDNWNFTGSESNNTTE